MNLNAHKIDRLSFWAVIGIGFFIMISGVAQIRSGLFSHDRVANAIREKLSALQEQGADRYLSNTSEGENLSALQEKDTDGDSLSDFEELYVHATSPYLADSDSDTVTDQEELAAGTNPNCPEGQACYAQESSSATTATAAEQAFADLNPAQLGIDSSTGEIDPEELRKKLLEYGVPKDVLDQTDDATLLQLFKEAISGGSVQGTNPLSAIEQQAEAVRQLSLDEKKQLLVQSGLDSATINGLDEETINELFEQAIAQAVKEVTEQGEANTNTNSNSNTNSN